MEWSEEGIALSVRKLGESSAVLSVLTRGHGRHAGLVRGGNSQRMRGMLQPGNRLVARWRGRLVDQLGSLTCELTRALDPRVIADRARLAAITSACALVETALPEREPLPRLYEAFETIVEAVETSPVWPALYVQWEVALLADLGYGLDLRCCAISGTTHDLAYVSPRTGRAVGRDAGAPWKERLLALPAFLVEPDAPAVPATVVAGLALTGYFLHRHVYAERGRSLPPARERLPDELRRGDRS
jgi:DNA repair protein RecO (recombination protein O)